MRRYALRDDQWDRIKEICRAARAMLAARRRTIGCSSKPFCSDFAPASLGAICPRALATEDRLSALQPVGQERRFRASFQALGQRSRQRVHDD